MLLTRINSISTPQGEVVLYRRSRGAETWVPKYVLYKAGCQVEEYRHIQSAHKGYNELVVQNATVIKIKEPRIKR